MGKIILTGATKGGVGKTCTSYNLAYSLAKMGKKVLAVDMDSQANLTTCFGVENPAELPVTIGHLMMAQMEDDELPDTSEYVKSRNGVDYIPSSMLLSAAESKLRTEMGTERILSDILSPIRDSYDYVIIDTPPSLGMLTINALTASDGVIITVNPQYLAMMGLQDFLRTATKVRNRLNPGLTVEGILITMCESRTNLGKVIMDQVAEAFEGQIRVFDSRIPYTVKVGESIYYSQPLLEYSPKCKACKAYLDFAQEVIADEG
jgi:chromosome partitioning protein